MIYVKFFSAVALLISLVWVVVRPGFDSALAVAVSFSALIALFVVDKKRKARGVQQNQTVSKSSVGIQAGGDVKVGNIGGGNHAE